LADGVHIDGTPVDVPLSHNLGLVPLSAAQNHIIGNYIGVNKTGKKAVGNGNAGVNIDNGAHDNNVGGTTGAERNIIAGNAACQVLIHGAGTMNNTVHGNYIGTDWHGLHAMHAVHAVYTGPDGTVGVEINGGASYNYVGGPVVGTGNVIAGND